LKKRYQKRYLFFLHAPFCAAISQRRFPLFKGILSVSDDVFKLILALMVILWRFMAQN